MHELSARIVHLAHPAGLRIAVMDIGATWLSCEVRLADGSWREVLLGCDGEDDYARQRAYLGAIIGRYANRITAARFALDGHEYPLAANNGPNNLHGGPEGFDRRRWRVLDRDERSLLLALDSPAGDQGFPGRAEVQVRYTLDEELGVRIDFTASVDEACPMALTSHAYFNLDGAVPGGDVRSQRLRIAAARYVPVDPTLAPVSDAAAVADTPFDFRNGRRIGDAWPELVARNEQLRHGAGYDHAFLLDAQCRTMTLPAAELLAADGRLTMQVFTDLPALQCYTGNYLAGTPARGATEYGAHAGIALEPGFPPDSPNQPEWSACILRPGQIGRSAIRYAFSRTG